VQGLSRKSRNYAGTVGTVGRTGLRVRGSSKLCEKNGMKWDEKCRQGAVDSGDGHASSAGMWMVRKMPVERELKRGGVIRTKRQSEANREGRAPKYIPLECKSTTLSAKHTRQGAQGSKCFAGVHSMPHLLYSTVIIGYIWHCNKQGLGDART
jgi:hypothetical protein